MDSQEENNGVTTVFSPMYSMLCRYVSSQRINSYLLYSRRGNFPRLEATERPAAPLRTQFVFKVPRL